MGYSRTYLLMFHIVVILTFSRPSAPRFNNQPTLRYKSGSTPLHRPPPGLGPCNNTTNQQQQQAGQPAQPMLMYSSTAWPNNTINGLVVITTSCYFRWCGAASATAATDSKKEKQEQRIKSAIAHRL